MDYLVLGNVECVVVAVDVAVVVVAAAVFVVWSWVCMILRCVQVFSCRGRCPHRRLK